MAPFNKILLLYIATSLFLCSFAQTSEAVEDEAFGMGPRSQGGDRPRSEFVMALNNDGLGNANIDQINKLFGERLRTLFLNFPSEKMKRDDDIPPGFIGVRGRRSRSTRDFTEILRTLLNNSNGIVVSPEMHNFIKGQMKKSDSNAYKDGFLGVRG